LLLATKNWQQNCYWQLKRTVEFSISHVYHMPLVTHLFLVHTL